MVDFLSMGIGHRAGTLTIRVARSVLECPPD